MKRPARLSATFVKSVARAGRYGDGRGGYGLSLLVKPRAGGGHSKSWSQTLQHEGRKVYVGLGAYPVITLARARERALENARLVAEGVNPLVAKRRRAAPTFGQAAETVVGIHAEGWKDGGKSAGQ